MSFTPSPSIAFRVGPVRSLPHMPALDGLRAIAVLAVIIYHADAAWLPGGYLGVEVFFTISGYLITALLLTEYERTGGIDFIDFWRRRARRLLPALLGLLGGVFVLAILDAPDALGSLGGQTFAALAYVMNWSLIFTEQSYFESFGRPPLLQHLWSLAIEEQFYLLMPPAFLFGRRLLGKRVVLGLVIIGAAMSTWLMWTGFDPTMDPSRLYYGTDTRAAGILVGVVLAMIWRPWAPEGTRLDAFAGTPIPDLVGLAGLGIVLHQFWNLGAYEPRLYQGGFLLIALATAGILFAVTVPGSLLSLPLSHRALRWVGVRSYGLYLWHWPVFNLLRPGVDTVLGEPWLTLVRLMATVALAELSYTFIETPIRQGRFREILRGVYRAAPDAPVLKRGVAVLTLSVFAVVMVGNVQLSNTSPAAAMEDAQNLASAEGEGGDSAAVRFVPLRSAVVDADEVSPDDGPDPLASPAPTADPTAEPTPEPTPTPLPTPEGPAPDWERVLIFGDSVMVAAEEQLAGIPGAQVDASIGRQWHELVDLAGDDIGPDDAVVIHLGSNGAATTDTIDDVLSRFADAGRVVLVNVRVPRPWEQAVNRSLSSATGRWPNTVLIDWHGASDGTPRYFAGDGVHVSAGGAEVLTGLISYGLDLPRAD